MGLTTRVARGGLLNFGGQSVTMLATLLATPWTLRLLGPERYGVLALMHVIGGYLAFADLGMGTASTRFGAMAHEQGDDHGEAAAIWSSLLLALIPATFVGATLFTLARPLVVQGLRLPPSLHAAAIFCVQAAAIAFIARSVAGVLNTPALVRLRVELLVPVASGSALLQIVIVPVVVWLGGGLQGAALVVAGVALATAVAHAIISLRLLPALRRPDIRKELLAPLASFGGALVISTIAEKALMNAEKLLIPRYASVNALAHYSVAFTLAFMMTAVPTAMLQMLLPALSRLHASGDRAGLELLYRRALHGMLYWGLPATLFVCVVARPFLTIWAGPEYGRESTLPFFLLIGGVLVEILSFPSYGVLLAYGRTDLIARCNVALLVPYLAVAVVLIQHFGAAGAAIAWSLRAIAGTMLFVLLARRESGFRFRPLPDRIGAFALSAAVLAAGAPAFLTSSLIARLAIAGTAVLIYGALILARVLTPDERLAVRRIIPFAK